MAKDKGRFCEIVNVWCVGKMRNGDWFTDVYEGFEDAARAIRELHPMDRKTVSTLGTLPVVKIDDELLQIEFLDNLKNKELFIDEADLKILKADNYDFDIDEYNRVVEKYGEIELD